MLCFQIGFQKEIADWFRDVIVPPQPEEREKKTKFRELGISSRLLKLIFKMAVTNLQKFLITWQDGEESASFMKLCRFIDLGFPWWCHGTKEIFCSLPAPPCLDLKVISSQINVTHSQRYSWIPVLFYELLYIKYCPSGESCQNSSI